MSWLQEPIPSIPQPLWHQFKVSKGEQVSFEVMEHRMWALLHERESLINLSSILELSQNHLLLANEQWAACVPIILSKLWISLPFHDLLHVMDQHRGLTHHSSSCF